nr:uncharacterized protein LOC128693999 isoform X1 [Cherax quadricarinatus]
MSGVTRCLLLTAAVAAAMPPSDQPFNPKDFLAPTARQETPRETFNGFPENFAHNLPTQEFMGDFARRTKRQAGVTSTIDGILSAPYGGLPATNHLQALLIRNANIRPPRQSVGPRRPKRPPPQPFPSISPPTSQSTAVGPPRFQPQFVRPQRDTVTSSLSPTRQHPLNRPPNFQVIHERFPEISSSSPDSSSSSDTAPSPQFSSPSSSSSRFSPSSSARLSESSSARIPHAPSSSPLTFSFPSFSPPQQFSPSARERPVQSPEPFSFPSFTGQQFGSSDFDSFESARLPRQRRDAREGQDVSSQLGQTIASPGEDAEAARQDSAGFIVGKPASFPGFHSIGGFGPMDALEKGNAAGSFMEDISFPSVDIPDINEKQPQFSPQQFQKQVSLVRDVPKHQSQPVSPHQQAASFSPSSADHSEDDFQFIFPHDTDSDYDTDPFPPSPPSLNTIPTTAGYSPVRPVFHRGKPKKVNRSPFSSFLTPFRERVRPSRHLSTSQRQALDDPALHREDPPLVSISNNQTRVRREADEQDSSDPANIPHRRVHRVQVEPQIPHSRNPRQFEAVSSSEASYYEMPHHFESLRFPGFGEKKVTPEGRSTGHSEEGSPLPVQYSSDFKVEADKVEVHTPDDDIIIPEGQSFYPSFNGHPLPILPSLHPAFFPPAPLPARVLGPRGGRFLPRSPAFRENPIQREQSSLRDLRNAFHSSGTREALHKPDFSFPTSNRPFHREHEHENNDNSLLGSGNFEILRGGTFYDEDDPNAYHSEYDHLLDDSYVVFPGSQIAPHTNNYVDDFFSNFRDFSEFAVRKADEGESKYLDDGTFFGSGYASEQVHQVLDSPQSETSSFKTEDPELGYSKEIKSIVVNEDKTKEQQKQRNSSIEVTSNGNSARRVNENNDRQKHRQAKNIQEVLEDIDPHPSERVSSSLTVDDKDPMLAVF